MIPDTTNWILYDQHFREKFSTKRGTVWTAQLKKSRTIHENSQVGLDIVGHVVLTNMNSFAYTYLIRIHGSTYDQLNTSRFRYFFPLSSFLYLYLHVFINLVAKITNNP